MMLLARKANVIYTLKSRSLSLAVVKLNLHGEKVGQEAILSCDRTYLQEILLLDLTFDLEQAALALYDNPKYGRYLQLLLPALKEATNNGAEEETADS